MGQFTEVGRDITSKGAEESEMEEGARGWGGGFRYFERGRRQIRGIGNRKKGKGLGEVFFWSQSGFKKEKEIMRGVVRGDP